MHSDANALTVTNVASVGGLCVAEVLARGLVHVAKTIVACTAGGRPLHFAVCGRRRGPRRSQEDNTPKELKRIENKRHNAPKTVVIHLELRRRSPEPHLTVESSALKNDFYDILCRTR